MAETGKEEEIGKEKQEEDDLVVERARQFLEKLQEWKRVGLPLIRPKHAE